MTLMITEHSYVLFLGGPTLAPATLSVPHSAVAIWCRTPEELLEQACRLRPRCVVLDGAAVADAMGLARRVRETARPQPILVLVGAGADSRDDVDHVVAPDANLAGELARLVRYAIGEMVRSAARIPCACRAVVELPDEQTLDLRVLDLSEHGVRLAAVSGLPDDDMIRLRICLPDGREPQILAQSVRRARDADDPDASVAYRFLEVDARGRAHLRAFLSRRVDATVPEGATDRTPASRPRSVSIIGRSAALVRMLDTIDRVAPTDVTVLLLGETGTGKELAARALHEGSPRADQPFVAVNCAALPENLVESELFGHEAGAFTGATKRKIGRIEQASSGTLFLDEIGDLPAPAQAKLLRALQERTIERVGGTEPIRVDFRLVAATNQDLESGAAKASFRRDLFFRLNVVSVHLPPLRERLEDVPLLVAHFLSRATERMGKRGVRLNDHALAALQRYPWPGNVRELENVCTRLIALAPNGSVIGPEHLDLFVADKLENSPLPSADLRDILDFCEREIVKRMLDRHSGNRTKTARSLGISRQALQQKLARFRGATASASDHETTDGGPL